MYKVLGRHRRQRPTRPSEELDRGRHAFAASEVGADLAVGAQKVAVGYVQPADPLVPRDPFLQIEIARRREARRCRRPTAARSLLV
jgi:hypothetical protein